MGGTSPEVSRVGVSLEGPALVAGWVDAGERVLVACSLSAALESTGLTSRVPLLVGGDR